MIKEKYSAPWYLCRTLFCGEVIAFEITDNKRGSVSPIASGSKGVSPFAFSQKELEDNANLIVAAPELLEALICATEIIESEYPESDPRFEKVREFRKLIAKVLGEAYE